MASTLKIDIDRAQLPRHFEAHLFRCARLWGLRVTGWWARRTARGWHVGVQVRDKLEPMTVCAMQAALGDDKARTAYNVLKILRGPRRAVRSGLWNVLYTEKVPL